MVATHCLLVCSSGATRVWDLSVEWSLAVSATGTKSSKSAQLTRKAFLLVFWLLKAQWKLPGLTASPSTRSVQLRLLVGMGSLYTCTTFPIPGLKTCLPTIKAVSAKHTSPWFP